MNETFKINAYFEENGESLEKLISFFLLNELEQNN